MFLVQLLKQHLNEAEEDIVLKTSEISRLQTELRNQKKLLRDKTGEKDILDLKFGVVSHELEESEKKNGAHFFHDFSGIFFPKIWIAHEFFFPLLDLFFANFFFQ